MALSLSSAMDSDIRRIRIGIQTSYSRYFNIICRKARMAIASVYNSPLLEHRVYRA